jgi:glycosyltransferase involved in cell wall biosynthesis
MTDNPKPPIRVMHLITELDVGGAEMMLCKLLGALNRERFTNVACSMTAPGLVADKIRALGIEVRSLGMKQGTPDPRAIFRLVSSLRDWKPDLLQTWMYHADFLGGVVGRFAGNIPVIWNIRNSEFEPGSYSRITLPLAWVSARLSSWVPTRIVSCSEGGRKVHEGMGYDASKMIVIPNGFDLSRYRPQPDATEYCSEQFGIPPEADAVAVVGRYHPQKDHKSFLAAAGLVARSFPLVRFVLCGDGTTSENATLVAQAEEAGIASRMHWLGRLEPNQLARIMSRCILVSSSLFGEGFSNVVGEAMACGAVCVVTDVGDSAWIVGDTGLVVRRGSAKDLAEAIGRVLSMSAEARSSLGVAARQRIANEFTIERIVTRYEDLYTQVYSSKASGQQARARQ